jgi:glyoxylase-like metal-dependent hydrolase (beta-lactamase superfamily II)
MLIIERFINELMTSNCYLVYYKSTDECIIIDPGTENCESIISYMDIRNLHPGYLILTHEHTDHTWGCNTLIDRYNSKVICSRECKKALPEEGNIYFRFYHDNPNYTYAVKRVDITLEDIDYVLRWNGHTLHFIQTPGHSEGSVCFSIENNLFTGDTIMQYKPFLRSKGGSHEKFKRSISYILDKYDTDCTKVYPGHGNPFYLRDYSVKI